MEIPKRRTAKPSDEDRLEVAKALHAACAEAVDVEEERGRALDQKLNQTASFAGVVLALVGATGGVLASSPEDVSLAWRIAIGTSLVLASLLLLLGIAWSFRAVAPKRYLGIDEAAVVNMTRESALAKTPVQTYVSLAATQREILIAARVINDGKSSASGKSTGLVIAGLVLVVVTLLLRTIENIV